MSVNLFSQITPPHCTVLLGSCKNKLTKITMKVIRLYTLAQEYCYFEHHKDNEQHFIKSENWPNLCTFPAEIVFYGCYKRKLFCLIEERHEIPSCFSDEST